MEAEKEFTNKKYYKSNEELLERGATLLKELRKSTFKFFLRFIKWIEYIEYLREVEEPPSNLPLIQKINFEKRSTLTLLVNGESYMDRIREDTISLSHSKWEKFFELLPNDITMSSTGEQPYFKGRREIPLSSKELKALTNIEQFLEHYQSLNSSYKRQDSNTTKKSKTNQSSRPGNANGASKSETVHTTSKNEDKYDDLQKMDREDLYRFAPLQCYEDELPSKIFEFNNRVESPMNLYFYRKYSQLASEMHPYNSHGYFYIISHLTEEIEGLIIYSSMKAY